MKVRPASGSHRAASEAVTGSPRSARIPSSASRRWLRRCRVAAIVLGALTLIGVLAGGLLRPVLGELVLGSLLADPQWQAISSGQAINLKTAVDLSA